MLTMGCSKPWSKAAAAGQKAEGEGGAQVAPPQLRTQSNSGRPALRSRCDGLECPGGGAGRKPHDRGGARGVHGQPGVQ